MRLQYAGQQDYWTTDEPHMSYFLSTYRRYTPIGQVLTDIPIQNVLKLGNTVNIQIPRRCDLLGRISLTVQFSGPIEIRDNISGLIEYAELVIGGRVINKVSGQYIFIRNQLDTNVDDNGIRFYNSQSTGYVGIPIDSVTDDTYSLELPFYFSQHPSLYIPICALEKQNVEVRIKLSEYDKYSSTRSLHYLPIPRDLIKTGFITINEIYITDFERNTLKSRKLEYPITQIQEHIVKLKEGELKKTIPLNFKNMVKEIYFFGEPDDLPYNYTELYSSFEFYTPVTGFYFRQISNFELKLNGITHINRDGDFFVYEQPYKQRKSRALLHDPFAQIFGRLSVAINDSEFGMYSFTPTPSILNPVGCLNMSRIIDQSCTIEFVDKFLINAPGGIPGVSANIEERQDFPNRKTTVHIYALSYNILVIRDNLCGLKY